MNRRALLDMAVMSGALLMASTLPTSARMPATNGGSDPETEPGPIVNYDRAAIRAEEAAKRKGKHAAKLSRRAAQRATRKNP